MRIAYLWGIVLLTGLLGGCGTGTIEPAAGSGPEVAGGDLSGTALDRQPGRRKPPRTPPCRHCGLDAGMPAPDAGTLPADAGTTSTDAAPAQHDAAPTSTDAAPAQHDAAPAPADAAPSQHDATPAPADAAPPQQDAGTVPPLSGYCYGDVPCAATLTRAPSAACASAGANGNVVISTAPSTTGYPETSLAAPAVGARVADPDFSSCITRATPAGWMNGYSRFSAVNADASMFLVRKSGGQWYLLPADQLGAPTRALGVSGDEAAPRWHGRDPDLLFYLSGSKLVRYRVSTAAATTALDVAGVPALASCGGIASVSLGGSEGDGSAGSRYWGFQVQTRSSCNGNTQHFVTTDLQTGETWVHTLPAGRGLPDNSSMSLTGKYFVANWQGSACGSAGGTMASPCGVMAYDLHLTTAFMVHPDAGHHDEGLTKEGHDAVIVKSNASDYIESVDLETRALTRIVAMNLAADAWDFHISGGNWARPGWVLVSQDSYSWNTHYLTRQIVAVELADYSVARVIHLAHHRTQSTDYWTKECHAAVNADFTRVAFHSNWYGGTTESDNSMYVLELPPDLLE